MLLTVGFVCISKERTAFLDWLETQRREVVVMQLELVGRKTPKYGGRLAFENGRIHRNVFDVFSTGMLSRASRRMFFRVRLQQVT